MIMDPPEGIINFPKKIINTSDAVFPSVMHITLTNMNENERIPFFIDTAEIDSTGIFQVVPS